MLDYFYGLSSSDKLAALSLGVAVLSLVLTLGALAFAILQLSYARVASSGSLLVSIQENFRQAWARYKQAGEQEKQYELSDLMNAVETACTLYFDGVFAKGSREIIEDYLCDVCALLQGGEETRGRIGEMLQQESTLRFYFKFATQHKPKIDALKMTLLTATRQD